MVVRYQQGVGVYLTLLSSNLFNLLLLLQNIPDEKGNFYYCDWKGWFLVTSTKLKKYVIIIWSLMADFTKLPGISHLIVIFPLFLGMVIYASEFKTKEKQK